MSRSDAGQISAPHSSGNLACGVTSPSPQLSQKRFQHSRKHSAGLNSPGTEGRGDSAGGCTYNSSLEVLHHSQPNLQVKRVDSGSPVVVTLTEGEEVLECPVCCLEKPLAEFMEVSSCHHRCCIKCLQVYFRIEITESRPSIECMYCSEQFHPNDIRAVVQDETLMQKYENFMVRRVLAMDSDTRWCPAPDCGYAVIAFGCAGCPKLQCERPGCGTYFCYHCKQHWHPNQTCDAARAERLPAITTRSDSLTYSQESSGAGVGAQSGKDVIKSCPRCGALIVKMDDLSCNHMICAVCGANFCWLCLKEMSDLHYLSLSGCTFWGRRPWSRKKKILCQLGTLVGAPVGIPLIAGLAVPAIIIGIPIWIGQKIYLRYQWASKHKRNLAITGGVLASLLAAPIVAGLIVGFGVPALLVYVYGVVPVSLCRSQGCGVTTNTSGVRFEFDEQGESQAQGPYSYTGDNQSIETGPNDANPSIAPSIGDASLGMTNSLSASGSHMERAGVLRDDSDRDSASHRAMAGNSINGSLCSATYSAQHHKLEVQADILELAVHCEKSSVGGESYNISLNDDASTRALAGSIISPKDKDGISLCSRHFDGASVAEADCDTHSTTSNKQGVNPGTSCPSSPRLTSSISVQSHRKLASPAPSTTTDDGGATTTTAVTTSISSHSHGGSYRGKKCTRFMDQVSEIEVGGLHNGGDTSTVSNSGAPKCERKTSDSSIFSNPNQVGGNSAQSVYSISTNCGISQPKVLSKFPSMFVEEPTLMEAQVPPKRRMKGTARANSFDVTVRNSPSPGSALKPSLSCSSTSSLGKGSRRSKLTPSPPVEESVGPCSCDSAGCTGVRLKAESTSRLSDGGAESRRNEMGGVCARRKSDSTCWSTCHNGRDAAGSNPCCAGSERALSAFGGVGSVTSNLVTGGRKTRGGVGEHLSQPSNLWDISELQAGMLPRGLKHTSGCQDMLAVGVGDKSSVFMQHGGKCGSSSSRLISASSSGSFCSSNEDHTEFIGGGCAAITGRRMATYETLAEDCDRGDTSFEDGEEKCGLSPLPSMAYVTSSVGSLTSSLSLPCGRLSGVGNNVSASQIALEEDVEEEDREESGVVRSDAEDDDNGYLTSTCKLMPTSHKALSLSGLGNVSNGCGSDRKWPKSFASSMGDSMEAVSLLDRRCKSDATGRSEQQRGGNLPEVELPSAGQLKHGSRYLCGTLSSAVYTSKARSSSSDDCDDTSTMIEHYVSPTLHTPSDAGQQMLSTDTPTSKITKVNEFSCSAKAQTNETYSHPQVSVHSSVVPSRQNALCDQSESPAPVLPVARMVHVHSSRKDNQGQDPPTP